MKHAHILSNFRLKNTNPILAVATVIPILAATSTTFAALGTVRATFNFSSSQFIADPNQPFVYAAIQSTDSIAVINTQTFQIDHTISLVGGLYGMALTPDGSTLYASENSTNSIAVINTSTFTSHTISVANPLQIAVGFNNRLFVLTENSLGQTGLKQVNASNGTTTGSSFPNVNYSAGTLKISPDQKSLYYAPASSPSTLYSFDVSTSVPSLTHSANTGGNEDINVSHNGNFITDIGIAPYQVSLFDANTLAPIGSLNTGAFADDVTLSPDDKFAYASRENPIAIQQYDLSNHSLISQFFVSDVANAMTIDSTGQDLFISYPGLYSPTKQTVIYDTGYSVVPEPTSLSLLTLSIPLLLKRRKK